jgi:predicted metal-dependent peptidase
LTDAEALERLRKARMELVLSQPFFGVLALSVGLEVSTAHQTAATNGTRTVFNPAFVETLTQDEVIGVMAHEVLHCANGHPWRRDARDPHGWNIACDLAINPIILDAGLRLPAGHLRDRAMDGKSAEWIYGQLLTLKVKVLQGRPGAGGTDVEDGEPGEAATAIAEWAEKVKQAANSAQAYGKLPLGCERFVDQATRPRVDWRAALRRFVQTSAREDYSWSQPNRRYLSQGLYLPALISERVGPVAVVVDTSGSIDSVVLNQFAAELRAIVEDVRPVRTHVFYADCEVHRMDTYDPDEPIVMQPVGGGGTAFGPALDAAEALEEPPCCLVYLTDLDGAHRATAPSMPLLWVTTNPAMTAPYGEIVGAE